MSDAVMPHGSRFMLPVKEAEGHHKSAVPWPPFWPHHVLSFCEVCQQTNKYSSAFTDVYAVTGSTSQESTA